MLGCRGWGWAVTLLWLSLLLLLLPCCAVSSSSPPSFPPSPFSPSASSPSSPTISSVSTARGWVGNSVGPGHDDAVYGQVLSAPNNLATMVMDPLTGSLYTNCVWEESAKEMVRISSSGQYLGRVEEAHGWSRTGGPAAAVGQPFAYLAATQGYIGEAYAPPQYPAAGEQWWGFITVNATDMSGVAVRNGTSYQHFLTVTSTSGMASALALHPTSQHLVIVHPTDASLQVWDTHTMTQVGATVHGAANWTSLTFFTPPSPYSSDSSGSTSSSPSQLWGVLAGQVYPVDVSTGQPSGPALPSVESAVSVAASHSDPTVLVVADGGLHTQQVLLFQVAGNSTSASTSTTTTTTSPLVLRERVGYMGGVWGKAQPGQPARGMRGDLRFEWLTSAGQGPDGSLVVACATNTVWQGSEMMANIRSMRRRQRPEMGGKVGEAGEEEEGEWEVVWTMEGNSWVDAGAFDPASHGRLLIMPNAVYNVSLPLSETQPSGRCIASTTDMVTYPQDPRLHQDNFSFQCARVVYVHSRRFLILTSMYGGIMALYRYESNDTYTAIPSALLLLQGPYRDMHKGELWPPGQPSSSYTWTDSNCDGRFDADEYIAHQQALNDVWSTYIDSVGQLWMVHGKGVVMVPLLGLDACGNLRYNREGPGMKSWPVPAEFSFIERIHYSPTDDVLMLTGWDTKSAAGHGDRWGNAGNLLVFYQDWSKPTRSIRASTALRSEFNSTRYPQGPVQKTVAWVDDLVFLVEGYSATVTVMDAATLTNLTAVLYNPSPVQDWHNGWIDVPDALSAVRVSDLEYLVALEDDYCAKTTLMSVQVRPNTSTLCARLAVQMQGNSTAEAEVTLLTTLVSTMWLGTPDTRHVSSSSSHSPSQHRIPP